MKVTMIGTGYVGLVTGTWLANLGNEVIGLDIDEKKVEMLKSGKVPIYEPGLEEMFNRNMKAGRLVFTTDAAYAVHESEVIFLAVGTPPGEFHEADLSAVKAVAKSIGQNMKSYKAVINKSTVPVGTADMVRQIISENQAEPIEFDVVSNPEFLREGAAMKDVENPDRIIVGTEGEQARALMEKLYKPVARVGRPIMYTDIRSAELIKYASNSMLATRISFMNQLSHLCEKAGANIKEVSRGLGLDTRIGPRFLQAGVGYGGSCFPKDVMALIEILKQYDCDASLFEAVHNVNEKQKLFVVEKLKKHMDLKGKKIALLGLSFKPKTDDMRESPSVKIARALQEAGAEVHGTDPVAIENARKEIEMAYHDNAYDTAAGADAVILVTEWNEYRNLDMKKIRDSMAGNIFIDGRNIYEREEMEALGFHYEGIGR